MPEETAHRHIILGDSHQLPALPPLTDITDEALFNNFYSTEAWKNNVPLDTDKDSL